MKIRLGLAVVAIASVLAAVPASAGAQARSKCEHPFRDFQCLPLPPVKSYVGAGSGTIMSTDSADSSKTCDDTDDCTTTLSGPIHVGGLGNGQFQATLTVAWKTGQISNVGGIACAAVVGNGSFGAGPVGVGGPISGTECEAVAGSPSSAHTFSLVFPSAVAVAPPGTFILPIPLFTSFAQGTGTLTISDFGIDPSSANGTYILDLRMAARILK